MKMMMKSGGSVQMTDNSNGPVLTIERIGAIVAVVASLSLLLSFVYDWGFLSALGISFEDAPTSLSDHISSWMVWLQVLLPAGFLMFTFTLFVKRLEYRKDGPVVDRDWWWTYRDPLLIIIVVFAGVDMASFWVQFSLVDTIRFVGDVFVVGLQPSNSNT